MKLMALVLLLAGWAIALAAVILLRSAASCTSFVLAGIAVEVTGLILLMRAHRISRRQQG